MADNYLDAVGFLVRYLVRSACGMAANSVRPANQAYPTGDENDEFATVLITNDEGSPSGAARRAVNYQYPAWNVATAYTIGTKVTYQGLAFVCTAAVTGGTGPATDASHWAGTTQATQVTETLDVWHEFMASVQFFRHALPAVDSVGVAAIGHGAYDRAARLQSLLMLSTNMELMQRFGLVFRGASPARNLAAVVNGTWEDRGGVDLFFGCCTSESVLLETIATAEIGLQAEWPGGHIDTQTIEVPS